MRNWESRVKQADGQCQHWHFTNSWTQNLSPLVIFPAHTAKQLSCVKKYKKNSNNFHFSRNYVFPSKPTENIMYKAWNFVDNYPESCQTLSLCFWSPGQESNIEWKSVAYSAGVLWGLDKDEQLLSRSPSLSSKSPPLPLSQSTQPLPSRSQ